MFNIYTNISCSNCVIENASGSNSRKFFVQMVGNASNMNVSFTNCSFINPYIVVAVYPDDLNETFTLSFADCLFEGSSPFTAVQFFHEQGLVNAQFVRSEFRNNVNGSLLFNSDSADPRSNFLIDSCLFHTVGNNTSTNTTHPTAMDDDNNNDHLNVYSAVVLNSLNTSVYIMNSTFRGLSVQFSSSGSGSSSGDDDIDIEAEGKQQERQMKSLRRYSNDINVVDENHRFDHKWRNERETPLSPFGTISAAIYSMMYGSAFKEDSHQPNVTIESCTFHDNSAFGGSIHIAGGFALITESLFERNSGSLGGAISSIDLELSAMVPPSIEITWCRFFNNSASAHGGAFYMANSNMTFVNSIFENNEALYGSVGFLDGSNFSQETSIRLEGCEFRDNIASVIGGMGSIYALDTSLEMYNCIIDSSEPSSTQVFLYALSSDVNAANISVYGISLLSMNGGVVSLEDVSIDMILQIVLAGGSLSCIRCTLNNTDAGFQFNHAAQLYVRDSSFNYNDGLVTETEGVSTGSEAVFENCFFYQNTGSFESFGSNITILSSSVIAGNVSTGRALFAMQQSRLNISDSTLLFLNVGLMNILEGEVYLSNTTIEDTSMGYGPSWIQTNITELTSFTAVNCKFGSTTFYFSEVSQY